MDRALAGDFDDLLAKLLRDLAFDGNDSFEAVDFAAIATFRLGALLAVLSMDFGMRDVDADAPELQLLVAGIKAQRHRGAGAKCDRQEVVGRWSGIEPAYAFGFIGEQPMPASLNRVLKLAFAGFPHVDMFDRARALRRIGGKIACQPFRNDPSGKGCVLRVGRPCPAR